MSTAAWTAMRDLGLQCYVRKIPQILPVDILVTFPAVRGRCPKLTVQQVTLPGSGWPLPSSNYLLVKTRAEPAQFTLTSLFCHTFFCFCKFKAKLLLSEGERFFNFFSSCRIFECGGERWPLPLVKALHFGCPQLMKFLSFMSC